MWSFCGVIGEPGKRVLIDRDRMPGARWFPDARLNLAENLLREDFDPAGDAIVFWGEDKVQAPGYARGAAPPGRRYRGCPSRAGRRSR